MTNKHTPGPWRAEPRGNLKARQFIEAGDFRIAECITRDQDANAEFIVRACNAHDDMLAALENLLTGCPDETFQTGHRLRIRELERLNGTIVMAKAAIAKARGE